MPGFISDPWDGQTSVVAVDCHVEDRPEVSAVLGPDGRPLQVKRPPVGFDLRPAAHRETQRR